MSADVPSSAVAKEWPLSCLRCRVVLSVVLPRQQVTDGFVLRVVIEVPLAVAEIARRVHTKIAPCNHRQVVWIRIMVKVSKIAEYCALLSQAFQKVVPDRRLVILVFKHDNECAIEMFRTPRTTVLDRVLTETGGSAPKKQQHTSKESRDS